MAKAVFSIYQLIESRNDDDYENNKLPLPFMSLRYMGKWFDKEPNMLGDFYKDVYDAEMNDEDSLEDWVICEKLFEIFNIRHPSDFHGHSMSVSDVVKLTRNNVTKYFFCDSFGFTEITDKIVK